MSSLIKPMTWGYYRQVPQVPSDTFPPQLNHEIYGKVGVERILVSRNPSDHEIYRSPSVKLLGSSNLGNTENKVNYTTQYYHFYGNGSSFFTNQVVICPPTYRKHVESHHIRTILKDLFTTLNKHYNKNSGGWGDPIQYWWHQAICLHIYLDYICLTKDMSYFAHYIVNSFNQLENYAPNFINDYNDDTLWYVRTWSKAYRFVIDHESQLKKMYKPKDVDQMKKKFLHAAEFAFSSVNAEWAQNSYHNGLTWEVDGDQICTIENVLFASTAYDLYLLTGKKNYLGIAEMARKFLETHFVLKDGFLCNGPINKMHKLCPIWSYIQGMYLEMLEKWFLSTSNPSKRKKIRKKFKVLAKNIINNMTWNGVLYEKELLDKSEGFPLNTDQEQFKGICVNPFKGIIFTHGNSDFRRKVLSFLEKNVDSVKRYNYLKSNFINAYWFDSCLSQRDFITHASGVSLFVTYALARKKHKKSIFQSLFCCIPLC